MNNKEELYEILQKAKDAQRHIETMSDSRKNKILLEMAEAVLAKSEVILEANKKDMALAYKNNLNAVGLDRLMLNESRIIDMVNVLKRMTTYSDPVGKVLEEWTTEDQLNVKKVSIPIGVVSIIYELRPSMTSDGAALSFKTGNVCVLKGADDTENSNHAIIKILQEILEKNNLPKEIITFVFDGSQEGIVQLVKEDKYLDVLLTRGGALFNRFIELHSVVPVIRFNRGLNHMYFDKELHMRKALEVSRNSKCHIPNICSSIETLLVHQKIAPVLLPELYKVFKKEETIIKGCTVTQSNIEVSEIREEDYDVEYLANAMNIRVVKDIEEAIAHIDKYGTGHSEAIITENQESAEYFMNRVDAACLYHNASTKFSDGATFHSGSEVGTSTNKLHTRGPLRINALTTYKYKMYGEGTTKLIWNGYFTPFSFLATISIGTLLLPTLSSFFMLYIGYSLENSLFYLPLFIILFIFLALISKFKIEKSNNKILKWASRAFYLNNEQLNRLEKRFEKYPKISNYLVQKLKGLKQFISLPSALLKLPKKAFIVFTILDISFWVTTFSLLGYFIKKLIAS